MSSTLEHLPGQDETFYLDECKEIIDSLEKQGMILVVGPGEIDKQIRHGITISPEHCLEQADWSIAQRKFSPVLLRFLNVMEGYETWSAVTLQEKPSFSRQDRHLIGMVELLSGTLRYYQRQGTGYPLVFLEEMETGLHPRQQRHIWEMLRQIFNEYGNRPTPVPKAGTEG